MKYTFSYKGNISLKNKREEVEWEYEKKNPTALIHGGQPDREIISIRDRSIPSARILQDDHEHSDNDQQGEYPDQNRHGKRKKTIRLQA